MALLASQAKLGNRRVRIGQETALIFRIHPRACDNARTDMRADFMLVGVDDRIECSSIDQSFFDEKRFQRFYAKRQIRRNCLMVVIVVVFLPVLRLPALWIRDEGCSTGCRALQETAAAG